MRRLLITLLTIALSSLLVFSFIGCEGDQGPAGPAGRDGVNEPHAPIITGVLAAPDSIGGGEYTVLYVDAYDPNGDAMTYSWSAESGELSSTDQSIVSWTAPADVGIYQISVTVSDEDGSTDASTAVGVNVYLPSVFPSYGANTTCGHCHDGNYEGWLTTGHAGAFDDLTGENSRPYCIQCHTTGFDDVYDFNDNLISQGVDNGGYDENPIAALEGITCEACHGPMGPNFTDHRPDLESPLRGETCAKCHEQNEEYDESGHGTAIERAGGVDGGWLTEHYIGRDDCIECHTNEGFLAAHDAHWVGKGMPAVPWQVTCGTCHDVHMFTAEGDTTNPYYLRGLENTTLLYGGPDNPDGLELTGWGEGMLCTNCHHSRSDEAKLMDQVENGNSRPGPHHGPQSDMLAGVGTYELEGYTYDRESPHSPAHSPSSFGNSCVKCHMFALDREEPGGPLYGHSFDPDVRACAGCHETATDFNVDGVQTEVEDLLAQLVELLPNDGEGNLLPYFPEDWTLEQRKAGYAYYFVKEDKSMGVHNPTYTLSMLHNSIDYLNSLANN